MQKIKCNKKIEAPARLLPRGRYILLHKNLRQTLYFIII